MIKKKFDDYFQQSGVKKNWFAEQIGVTPQLLYFWMQGDRKIPQNYWKKIIIHSGGYITLCDLMQTFIKDFSDFQIMPGKSPDSCCIVLK